MKRASIASRLRIAVLHFTAVAIVLGPGQAHASPENTAGFTVHDGYDHGRNYRFEKTLSGDVLKSSASRPMQVGIWYPAKSKNRRAMTLRAYTRIGARADDPASKHVDALADAAIRALEITPSIDQAQLNQSLDENTNAFRDARPKPGRFPVILMAMGSGAPWYNNYGLAETLAMRGYVVLASRSAANNHIYMSTDQEGVEAAVADLSYLAALAHELPYADPSRMGVIGRSWGAVPAIVFAGRNEGVDAIVSLDGTISYNVEQLRSGNVMSSFIGGDAVKDPIFVAVGAKRPERATPIDRVSYFENVANADAYLAEYHEMQHASFASRFLALYFKGEGDLEDNPHFTGFTMMAEDVGQFLDHYVANGIKGLVLLPENNIRIVKSKAASTISPDQNAFSRAAFDMGAEAAIALYREITLRDPEQKLFGWRTLVNLCELLLEQGRYEDAISIARFSAEQYPDRSVFIALEGKAHFAARNFDLARTAFERALEQDPEQSIAETLLERLP